jgi:hypothetical protein
MRKSAITSFSAIEPESNVVAGMPASPQGGGLSKEVFAIQKVKAFPGTTATKGEAGMSDAVAENSRQMLSELERKFGSDHPFVAGFVYELQKEAAPAWLMKLVGSQKREAIPKTQLQQGISKLRAHVESRVKPQLTTKTPMPHEQEGFPLMDRESRTVAKLDARAAKGRTSTPALQV